jgi:hypothetical protein
MPRISTDIMYAATVFKLDKDQELCPFLKDMDKKEGIFQENEKKILDEARAVSLQKKSRNDILCGMIMGAASAFLAFAIAEADALGQRLLTGEATWMISLAKAGVVGVVAVVVVTLAARYLFTKYDDKTFKKEKNEIDDFRQLRLAKKKVDIAQRLNDKTIPEPELRQLEAAKNYFEIKYSNLNNDPIQKNQDNHMLKIENEPEVNSSNMTHRQHGLDLDQVLKRVEAKILAKG